MARGTLDRAAEDTHALIVSASRYFHNYRHMSNALLFYDMLRRLGLPDSRIVLMIAGLLPCDVHNTERPFMYGNLSRRRTLFPGDAEVDWRQEEVTVESVIGVLTNRMADCQLASSRKRLHSDQSSRLVIYLTGHGSEPFLKFNDQYELAVPELTSAILDAFALGRFSELVMLVDTCQASSLTMPLHAVPSGAWRRATVASSTAARALPRVATFASSARGEHSYSYEIDSRLGVALSDAFTFQVYFFIDRFASASAAGSSSVSLADIYSYVSQRGRLIPNVVAGASGCGTAARGAFRSMRLHALFGAAPPRLRMMQLPSAAATEVTATQSPPGRAPDRSGVRRLPMSTCAQWEAAEARVLSGSNLILRCA